MKKFFSILVAMVMLVSLTANAHAVDVKKFINVSEELRKEFLQLEKTTNLRDFDFLLKMTFVYVGAWNEQIGKDVSEEAQINTSRNYVAILSAQYISMKQYIKEYVIKMNPHKAQTQNNCNRLLQLLDEGLNTLK